jgi:hypothetical protein
LDGCSHDSSNVLHSINLHVQEVGRQIGEMSLAVTDTARDMKTFHDILPELSGNVTGLRRDVQSLVEWNASINHTVN